MFKESFNPMLTMLTILFWIIVLGLILGAFGVFTKALFAPASVAIDNAVFHESQQFNDGMARDLDNMRASYLDPATTAEAKTAIRATIAHRFAGYDARRLPGDLQLFLRQVRGF